MLRDGIFDCAEANAVFLYQFPRSEKTQIKWVDFMHLSIVN